MTARIQTKSGIKTEQQIQSDCVTWLWNNYPETRGHFFAVNNNSEHVARAMNRKAIGVVRGVSDTIFLWHGETYLIEFKTNVGKQSKIQKAWGEKMTQSGFDYTIIRSLDEFKFFIKKVLC
jgi:ATP-dependent exoDNAse (exonuclease V) beta subunit